MKYERTGEYRVPKFGEWYEAISDGKPTPCDGGLAVERWILKPDVVRVKDVEVGTIFKIDKTLYIKLGSYVSSFSYTQNRTSSELNCSTYVLTLGSLIMYAMDENIAVVPVADAKPMLDEMARKL